MPLEALGRDRPRAFVFPKGCRDRGDGCGGSGPDYVVAVWGRVQPGGHCTHPPRVRKMLRVSIIALALDAGNVLGWRHDTARWIRTST